jgi:hypothetical protein
LPLSDPSTQRFMNGSSPNKNSSGKISGFAAAAPSAAFLSAVFRPAASWLRRARARRDRGTKNDPAPETGTTLRLVSSRPFLGSDSASEIPGRLRRRESSVEQALIEMYLAGVQEPEICVRYRSYCSVVLAFLDSRPTWGRRSGLRLAPLAGGRITPAAGDPGVHRTEQG